LVTLGVNFRQIQTDWHPAYRIVPSRFPSINLFDRVASPEDFEALYALEAMTNARIRNEVGEIDLVPHDERLFGPGSGPIMAAFTHLNPNGSRFSDGSYGVFYAAKDKATAIAETRHHQANFLRATNEAPIQLQMRVYHVEVSGRLHDLRMMRVDDPVYSPDSYAASQVLGRTLRMEGSPGIRYRSVRLAGKECVAIFKTAAVSNCRHASQLLYQWDGKEFAGVYEKLD
jgi:hypothetical protein